MDLGGRNSGMLSPQFPAFNADVCNLADTALGAIRKASPPTNANTTAR